MDTTNIIEHYEYTQKITADELKTLEKFLNQTYHNLMLVVGHISGNTWGLPPLKQLTQILKKVNSM